MTTSFLACGPYVSETALTVTAVLFLLVKPVTYFAYVRAFRYRVSRAIPMTIRRAMGLALLRSVLGVLLVGGGWAAFSQTPYFPSKLVAGWVYLYLARLGVWWLVGARFASLRGKRLAGWIVGGMVINMAFDIAVVAGLLTHWAMPLGIVVGVCLFVAVIEARGTRSQLRHRFDSTPHCRVCEYNLTGNLSGICPECGTPIVGPLLIAESS